MPDNDLPHSIDTEPVTPEQRERLDNVIGGKINGDVKRRVLAVFTGYGWDQSAGVRTVLTAFLESAQVRDAVFKHFNRRAVA